jgi:aminocarboxymuconate-semialdehyde decarboxylase
MTPHETIDAHAHIYPEGCFSAVVKTRADFRLVDNPRGQSLLYRGSHVMSMPADQDNLPKRLASMDQAGITMAILSVGALNVGWSGAGDAAAAHFVNDGLAAACRQQPARFRFVAVLPCTDQSTMRQELDRALGLGAAGVGISTNFGDFQLDAPELRGFWREMSRRKLMVLVHPTTPCDAPQNDPGTFLSVGYPGETAMAATKLALSGVLEEYPDVKIVWSHLGGSLAMILDRIDRGYQRFRTAHIHPATTCGDATSTPHVFMVRPWNAPAPLGASTDWFSAPTCPTCPTPRKTQSPRSELDHGRTPSSVPSSAAPFEICSRDAISIGGKCL